MPDHTPEATTTKQCSKCRELKSATTEHFARDRKRRDGFCPQCKVCMAENGRKYSEANKEKVSARHKAYHEANKEKIAEYQRRYHEANPTKKSERYQADRAANPEKFKKRSRQFYAANREKIRESNRKFYQRNREKILERQRRYLASIGYVSQKRYAAANREKNRERNRRYSAANPEKVRSHVHIRNARIRAAEGHHTDADIKRQYEAQNRRCYYCNCELNGKYETDHVIPLCRGGSDSMENIVVACMPCNRSKGTKLPHEWEGSNRLL